MIVLHILSSMIDLFSFAFGITVGVVWSKSQRAGMAVLAVTIGLLGLLHFSSGISSVYGHFVASCSVGLWALITFLIMRKRERDAEAEKASQTLKP